MKKWLIGLIVITLATSCRRGIHQTVDLKNSSSESIYYLISKNTVPHTDEIESIRPRSYESSGSEKNQNPAKNAEDSLMRMRIEQNLYRFRIKSNDSATILSSESAEVFVDVVSIQSIIRDRYNGKANVFIIKESDLKKNSDEDILDKKLYAKVISLTEEDITNDILAFEYK